MFVLTFSTCFHVQNFKMFEKVYRALDPEEDGFKKHEITQKRSKSNVQRPLQGLKMLQMSLNYADPQSPVRRVQS